MECDSSRPFLAHLTETPKIIGWEERLRIQKECATITDDEGEDYTELEVLLPQKGLRNPTEATTGGTVFNIVNVYLGLGILSQPYALAKGGWAAALALLLFGIFSRYTGTLIVRCFDRLDLSRYACRGGRTYSNLGHLLMGTTGSGAVFTAAILELAGVLCMCQVILWKSVGTLLWTAPTDLIAVGATVLILPILYLPSIGRLFAVSALGSLASLGIVAAAPIALYTAPRPAEVRRDFIVPDSLPLALGISMLSFSAHATLPSIHRSMRDGGKYGRALSIAFVVVFALHCVVGAFGYWAWGEGCQVLLTDNLTPVVGHSPHLWQVRLSQAVAVLVAIKCIATIVPVCYVVVEYFHPPPEWGRLSLFVSRCLVCLISGAAAYFCRDYLAYVEAFTGGICALSTTFVFPLLFYLHAYRDSLPKSERIRTRLLLGASLTLMVVIPVSSVLHLLKHRSRDEIPPA